MEHRLVTKRARKPTRGLKIHTSGHDNLGQSEWRATCGQAGKWDSAEYQYGGPTVSKSAFLFIPDDLRCRLCEDAVLWTFSSRQNKQKTPSYRVRIEVGVALYDRRLPSSQKGHNVRLIDRLLRGGAALAELPEQPFTWSDVDIAFPNAAPYFEIHDGLAWAASAKDTALVLTIDTRPSSYGPKATLAIVRDPLTAPRWMFWDPKLDWWEQATIPPRPKPQRPLHEIGRNRIAYQMICGHCHQRSVPQRNTTLNLCGLCAGESRRAHKKSPA